MKVFFRQQKNIVLALLCFGLFSALSCSTLPTQTSVKSPSLNSAALTKSYPVNTRFRILNKQGAELPSVDDDDKPFKIKDYPTTSIPDNNDSYKNSTILDSMSFHVVYQGDELPGNSAPLSETIYLNSPEMRSFESNIVILEYGKNSAGQKIATKLKADLYLRADNHFTESGKTYFYRKIYPTYAIFQSQDGRHFNFIGEGRHSTAEYGNGYISYYFEGYLPDRPDCTYALDSYLTYEDDVVAATGGTLVLDPVAEKVHASIQFRFSDKVEVRYAPSCSTDYPTYSTSLAGTGTGEFVAHMNYTEEPPQNDLPEFCQSVTLENGDQKESCLRCPPGQDLIYENGYAVSCTSALKLNNQELKFNTKSTGDNAYSQILSIDNSDCSKVAP